MELYLNPSDVSEIIGVDVDIIKQTLNQKHPEIEPFLRVTADPSDETAEPQPMLQLRIDGLAPLITQLSFNIPTDDIIENLICQIVHIAYLRENNENLESEKATLFEEIESLREKIVTLQEENSDLRVQVNNLLEKPKTWRSKLFNIGE